MNLPDGATPDFPSDIVAEIFFRLPVKSLCRFKCASKPWRSLISNPNFAKKHFDRNKKTRNQPAERLFTISESLECHSLDLESLKLTTVELRYKQTPIRFKKIWNSCDGLLLLSDFYSSLFLVNPSTGECRKLPPSPYFIDSAGSMDNYGFGYDLSVNDYKVVRISIAVQLFQSEEVVSIYSLRTNSWKKIDSHPQSFCLTFLRDGIFTNGSLHWLGQGKVLSLNLASESFQSVPLPRSADSDSDSDSDSDADGVTLLDGLNVIDGCLCGFELGFNMWEPINVWVMQDYGVRDSWIKFTVHYPPMRFILPLRTHYPPMRFILPLRTGKLLLCTSRKLAFYDLRAGEVEELTVGDIPTEAINYEESLIRLQE